MIARFDTLVARIGICVGSADQSHLANADAGRHSIYVGQTLIELEDGENDENN